MHTSSLCLLKHATKPQLDDRYLDLIVTEVRDVTEKKFSLDNFLPRENELASD